MRKLINIDNGGTLTDFCVLDGPRVRVTKTLTTPHDLSSCVFEGLARIAADCYGEADVARLLQDTDYIRYSTTQGTNALVERKGPRLGVVLGADDDLDRLLPDAAARDLFAALVGDRVGRVADTAPGPALDAAVTRAVNALTAAGASRLVVSLAGADFVARERAIERVVIRRFPTHLLGAVPVTLAGEMTQDPDPSRRLFTALFNAFLHPAMERFLYSAEHRMKRHRARNPLLVFRNDGGSARVAKTIALKTYSSGPRGGMEGARALARHYGIAHLVTCDVGGTTTDVGVVVDGGVPQTRRGRVEDVAISFPLCALHSEGVGGSSIVRVVDGRLAVGPESVGAAPGPACFARGGTSATMTDCALLAGLIAPDTYFGGELALDAERARRAVTEHVAAPLGLSADAALEAIEAAWVAKVAQGVRRIVAPRPDSTLLAFGGAGALLATRLATTLGIDDIVVPGLSAVFSAFGIGFSDLSQHYQASLPGADAQAAAAAWSALHARAARDMYAEGAAIGACEVRAWIAVTRAGSETTLPWTPGDALPSGCEGADETTLHVSVTSPIRRMPLAPAADAAATPATTAGTRTVLVDGTRQALPLYRLQDLAPGAGAAGPAIVEDPYFTGRIDAGWRFTLTGNRDLHLTRRPPSRGTRP